MDEPLNLRRPRGEGGPVGGASQAVALPDTGEIMETVVSRDGTKIAFDKAGDGPAVVLVDGAFGHRAFGPNQPLAPVLAEHFSVYTYDRRGRGGSGDTEPYAVEREIEDLEAVIKETGGSACVYGISSGAALVLAAADQGLAIRKLAVFEAPFVVDDTRPPIPDDYLAELDSLIAADRRGAAVKLFMTKAVGLPSIFVAFMPILPAWSKLKSVAHTVPYDARSLGDTGKGRPLPADRWSGATMPTLVISGGKSPTWMQNAMRALAETLPKARHRTLEGQMHVVKAKAMAPVLVEFFGD
jgi:pimeloyl-ACP methyl ester carboxylesterase